MGKTPDTWNPAQYEKFQRERELPGLDLIAGITPAHFPRGIDLGCGTGALTERVQKELGISEMLGVDNSESMLNQARLLQTESLKFETLKIEDFSAVDNYDLVFSNAAVQWCENHAAILASIVNSLRTGGQLAIQMPANHDYATHRLADQLASEAPYSASLNGIIRPHNVQLPEWYAETLYRLGLSESRVELKVYAHLLNSRGDVIEWVKGTLLTWYESRLTSELFQQFLTDFRTRLFTELPDDRPFFYPFKRIFLWGRK